MSQSLTLKTSPQLDAATTMLHRRNGARFPPNVTLCNQAKELNLGFVRPENLVSRGLRVQADFSHLHRGTLELCQSDHQVLGHFPDQGPSPLIAQFGWTARSRKRPGS